MTDSDFQTGMKIACTCDVSSEKDSVVVYSISFQETKQNRDDAIKFVREHPDKMMIEHTECGAKLIESGFENSAKLTPEETMLIWAEASRRFIAAAQGNITAFVENADPRSVFLSVELPNILKNEHIQTVNQIDKFKFAEKFNGLN